MIRSFVIVAKFDTSSDSEKIGKLLNSKIYVSKSRQPFCLLPSHQDFTIDGDVRASTDSDDFKDLYRDKLIYATGKKLECQPSPETLCLYWSFRVIGVIT